MPGHPLGDRASDFRWIAPKIFLVRLFGVHRQNQSLSFELLQSDDSFRCDNYYYPRGIHLHQCQSIICSLQTSVTKMRKVDSEVETLEATVGYRVDNS